MSVFRPRGGDQDSAIGGMVPKWFSYYAILMVMNHFKTPRLKPLLDAVPPGFIVDASWMKAQGINAKSIHDYVARGWIERVVHGVYRRPLPEGARDGGVSWQIALLSLQRISGCDAHLGGETALDLAGHIHYLNLGGSTRVHLYGIAPAWLKRLPVPEQILVHRDTLFGGDSVGIEDVDVSGGTNGWVVDVWRWPVRAASPERAILEAIDELPSHASFEHLDRIFEGLTALRPKLLMKLLVVCRSVKVLRLFFVFADRHDHPWRKYLDTGQIDFGSGPRALVEGGRFHPIYHISLPEFLMSAEPREGGDA